ncbi:MAG: N-acetylglucosamine-6-phosphate deacetylase [Bacteroidales bacterium]|nr:N-acetylglucosamine-6-phosphate deacetylase [Candidatus Cryptobacteroides onthequi]
MNRFKLTGGEIITPFQNLGVGTVLVENGTIIGVERGIVEGDDFQNIDVTGHYVMPGFIDIHSHGAGNADFMDCTAEACLTIAREHARHGTTLLYPTTLASDNEEMMRFLEVYERVKNQKEGAAFGGLHLEGPYFAYEFRGAQDPRYLKNPDPSDYMPILDASSDIKRWSVAPELPGALDFGRMLRQRGILPSIAHTSAIYDDVVEAYDAGYTLITHFYSCMNGVVRRNAFRHAGCIEAGFLLDDMSLEVIGDGIHVPKELLKLILKNKDVDKVILCTDSMRGAGMPENATSILGSLEKGQTVYLEDGVAKVMDRSCFAGSIATTDRLVRTMHFLAGQPLTDAVRMISANPAAIMGVGDRKGRIQKGYDADIVVCGRDLYACETYVMGNRVF